MLEWFKGRGDPVADGEMLCDIEFEEVCSSTKAQSQSIDFVPLFDFY